jgi:hypothetical protein
VRDASIVGDRRSCHWTGPMPRVLQSRQHRKRYPTDQSARVPTVRSRWWFPDWPRHRASLSLERQAESPRRSRHCRVWNPVSLSLRRVRHITVHGLTPRDTARERQSASHGRPLPAASIAPGCPAVAWFHRGTPQLDFCSIDMDTSAFPNSASDCQNRTSRTSKPLEARRRTPTRTPS